MKQERSLTPEMLDTLPKLLRHNAKSFTKEVAYREKSLGNWHETNWRSYLEKVQELSLGLKSMGLERGDVVLIIGNNRPLWLWSEIATQVCGAKSLGSFCDALEDELALLLSQTKIRMVIAEDDAQVEKIWSLGEKARGVTHIIYAGGDQQKLVDDRLIALDEVLARGQKLGVTQDSLFDKLVDATRSDDIALLSATSGSKGVAKLFAVRHQQLLQQAADLMAADPRSAIDEYVAVLPLAMLSEQLFVVVQSLVSRMKINFVENQANLFNDLREIKPTVLHFSPRVWEALTADLRYQMQDVSAWKRGFFKWCLAQGLKQVTKGRRPFIANLLLFSILRDRLGFTRLHTALSGGAPLSDGAVTFLLAIGVPLKQYYGQVESMGVNLIQRQGKLGHGNVGKVICGVAVNIDSPDRRGVGNIRLKLSRVLHEYHDQSNSQQQEHQQEQYQQQSRVEKDGWWLTGDIGYLDEEEQLVIVDRSDDVGQTTRGIEFSPLTIEAQLKSSPFIADAVVLGDNRDHLVALIGIRYSTTAKWAMKKQLKFASYEVLARHEAVQALVKAEVEGFNLKLSVNHRIEKFVLVSKAFNPDDGELTRDHKIRRAKVAQRYKTIIDGIYADQDFIEIESVDDSQISAEKRKCTQLSVITLSGIGAAAAPVRRISSKSTSESKDVDIAKAVPQSKVDYESKVDCEKDQVDSVAPVDEESGKKQSQIAPKTKRKNKRSGKSSKESFPA